MIRTTSLLKKDIQKINYTCPENSHCRNLKFLEIIRKQKQKITELRNIIEKQEKVINKTIEKNNILYNKLQQFHFKPNSFED